MKTLFQKIIDREIPSNIVFEDDEIIAIHDISPIAPVHILIIPKKLIATIKDLQEEDAFLMAKLIFRAKIIAEEFQLEGYKLLFNVGEKGGQSVFHVHLHLIGGGEIDLKKLQ